MKVMTKQKQQPNSSEKIVKKDVRMLISTLLTRLSMTFALSFLSFQKKVFSWNIYHSAYNTPYVGSYAMFSVTGDTKYLKRIKWIYTPKLLLLDAYVNISNELSKILGNKNVKARASLVKDIQYNETKLTRLFLAYYVLNVRDDDNAYSALKQYGLKGKDRESTIKLALNSIKMIELKLQTLIEKYETSKQESKVELDDYLQNKIIYRKNGYLGDGDCTVAEYGNASKLFKKEMDRLTKLNNGK